MKLNKDGESDNNKEDESTIVESPAFRKVGQVDKGGIAAAAAFGPDVS